MSRQLFIYKYIPKRRHTEEEEGEEESTTTSVETVDVTVSSTAAQPAQTGQQADDIASSLQCPPCQPVDIQFPITYFSGKARSFNLEWFQQYSWLEYSVKKDAAYCYPCRLLNTPSTRTSRPEKAFSTTGFRDWKHATGSKGMLLGHNNCISHKQAVVAWEQFKATATAGSVAEQLGSSRAEQIRKNRHYIKTVAEVVLLCSKQVLVSCITYMYVLLYMVYLCLGPFILLPVYYIQVAEAFTEKLMIDDLDLTDKPNFCGSMLKRFTII